MKIVKNEKVTMFDVDQTLIRLFPEDYEPEVLTIEHYGEIKVSPINQHIEALKELKSKDYYVVVWSHSGTEWAEKVVKALKLEEQVDCIITKPLLAFDDEFLHIPPTTKHVCLNEVGDNIFELPKLATLSNE